MKIENLEPISTIQEFIALQDLLGREKLRARLLTLADSGKNIVLLLNGAKGLGKKVLANAFSQLLLCEERQAGEYACLKCQSCHYVAVKSHPDLVQLPAQNQTDNLTVEEIRDFCNSQPMLQPLLGNKRCLIIDLSLINEAGQNLLLKTLESSALTNNYILLNENSEHILPTILSRVQLYNLPYLSQAVLEKYLATLPQAKSAMLPAKDLLAVANGNIGKLKKLLADPEFQSQYHQLEAIFNASLKADLKELLTITTTELTAYKEKDLRPYLAEIGNFYFYQLGLKSAKFRQIYQAWEEFLNNLKANGSFELQLQAFLVKYYQLKA